MKRIKGIEVIDITFTLITLLAFVLAVSGSISGYVRPHHFKWVSLSNNILPGILIICGFLMIYWIFRKSWRLLIPLFSIIINTFTLLSFFQLRGEIKVLTYVNEDIIKIVNYNLSGYIIQEEKNNGTKISKFFIDESPDIICLQEMKHIPIDSSQRMSRYIEHSDDSHIGLAILSRYKIIKKGTINFEDSPNRVIWADMSTDKGPVRIINIHLQSTRLAKRHATGESVFSSIRSIKDNNERRATQAETVRHLIDTTVHTVILCGNMNDTPLSYTYTKLKGENLIDGFREAGSKFGGTYRGMAGLFRLDYIFHSNEFKSVRYTTPDKEWSDHKPVISELVYQN